MILFAEHVSCWNETRAAKPVQKSSDPEVSVSLSEPLFGKYAQKDTEESSENREKRNPACKDQPRSAMCSGPVLPPSTPVYEPGVFAGSQPANVQLPERPECKSRIQSRSFAVANSA